MGVYIKGLNKKDALLFLHYQMPFCFDIKDEDITEIEEPHGRLVDYEEIEVDVWEDFDGLHYSLDAKTMIEAEDE